MRFIFPKFIFSCILVFTVFLLSGCFSTLQTAKTSDGFSFTGGLYSYTIEKHSYPESHYEDHYLLILMPRYGWAATEKKFGLEGGIRLVSDLLDQEKSGKPFWIFLEEFKLQIPRNRYLDLAFGVDFWLILPGSVYILASKDLSKTFALYGSGELFGGLYSITLGENKTGFYPKLTLGSEINFYKNFSALIEIENWFNTGWDARENIRFAAGVKVIPAKREK
ncbi:MAG: hypothetical protein AMJ91_04845 [candidate division Zixibacteria bacterium SM23_73_3]|nr:MAG: hypothetical protein AMJ91_04845 [candidate division Zixibacteria bacterium SM23_73_3]